MSSFLKCDRDAYRAHIGVRTERRYSQLSGYWAARWGTWVSWGSMLYHG